MLHVYSRAREIPPSPEDIMPKDFGPPEKNYSTQVRSFSFIYLFIYLFIHSFIYLLIYSFIDFDVRDKIHVLRN